MNLMFVGSRVCVMCVTEVFVPTVLGLECWLQNWVQVEAQCCYPRQFRTIVRAYVFSVFKGLKFPFFSTPSSTLPIAQIPLQVPLEVPLKVPLKDLL